MYAVRHCHILYVFHVHPRASGRQGHVDISSSQTSSIPFEIGANIFSIIQALLLKVIMCSNFEHWVNSVLAPRHACLPPQAVLYHDVQVRSCACQGHSLPTVRQGCNKPCCVLLVRGMQNCNTHRLWGLACQHRLHKRANAANVQGGGGHACRPGLAVESWHQLPGTCISLRCC